MNRTIKKCCWLVQQPDGKTQKPCCKPTKFKYVLEDDGHRYRDWDTLCPEHRDKADAQPKEEE